DFLNIDLGENFHEGKLSIYNMQGELIQNVAVDNLSSRISVADLEAGVYELILSDENGKRTHSSWVKY
ncbi:MAG TPA: T9SS type A sorting domain-containing protein, partial [Bacteroidia bacterium]|nr:T9SS type A sorting domain-containing protein [Bacteroidia bacterium]